MSVTDKDTPNVEMDVKELLSSQHLEVLPPLPDEVKASKPLERETQRIDIPPKKEHLEGRNGRKSKT